MTHQFRKCLAALAAIASLAGCLAGPSASDSGAVDAGAPDAGVGLADAGVPDAGDAGAGDAGAADAGLVPLCSALAVDGGLPDPAFTQCQVPPSSVAGASIPVARKIENVGGAATPATGYAFVLSNDTSLSLLVDQVLATGHAVPLLPGGVDLATEQVSLPAVLAPGTYRVFCVLDVQYPELGAANDVCMSNELVIP